MKFKSLLGSGGMGEVYRVRDSRLKLDVAIKVLPDAFSRDAERVARFQREAEVLASLNHPHIATIYDLAEFDDARFLVLELVEGETLVDRLARGAIPANEALKLAVQIADALDAAHEKGVVHRDVKPGNIKITGDGAVKVLDLGLAKVRQASGSALSDAPTMLSETQAGTILGTAAYMSPEQTQGKAADRTSDVWAYGCVLYEMLTARRAFDGATVAEILVGILKVEPDWTRLPADTPQGIRRLLERCLQKEEKQRIRDMRDVRIEIADALAEPLTSQQLQPIAPARSRLAWIFGVAFAATLAGLTVWIFRPGAPVHELRLEISTPATAYPASIAISPDGLTVVFESDSRLWLRALDSTPPRALKGTDDGYFPFWSPDNRKVAFFTKRNLKSIDIQSESVQTLADAEVGFGGAWSRDGVILYGGGDGSSPLHRISDNGGNPVQVTQLAPLQASHKFPQFLPDGRHFLFYVAGSPEVSGIYLGQLDKAESRRLLAEEGPAVYESSGHLLFVHQQTLFAQSFDLNRMELTGDRVKVGRTCGA